MRNYIQLCTLRVLSYLGIIESHRNHTVVHPWDGLADGAVTLCGVTIVGGISAERLAVGIVIAAHRVADEEGHGGRADRVSDVRDLDHDWRVLWWIPFLVAVWTVSRVVCGVVVQCGVCWMRGVL